ncbi:MAG: type II toxin-antitoxin system PemK/MazF family toxin [Planctomycetes bacterium]|nr:type II toxin-antitoxin system PemK/MazF family toxin [Planctomycetota bacterium]
MVTPSAGAVVLVPFPFSDLSQAKLRPAVVLADAGRGDWILCQITSNPYGDPRAVPLVDSDFASGSLQLTSYARPAKLFTASRDLMTSTVGQLRPDALARIIDPLVTLLRPRAR